MPNSAEKLNQLLSGYFVSSWSCIIISNNVLHLLLTVFVIATSNKWNFLDGRANGPSLLWPFCRSLFAWFALLRPKLYYIYCNGQQFQTNCLRVCNLMVTYNNVLFVTDACCERPEEQLWCFAASSWPVELLHNNITVVLLLHKMEQMQRFVSSTCKQAVLHLSVIVFKQQQEALSLSPLHNLLSSLTWLTMLQNPVNSPFSCSNWFSSFCLFSSKLWKFSLVDFVTCKLS